MFDSWRQRRCVVLFLGFLEVGRFYVQYVPYLKTLSDLE